MQGIPACFARFLIAVILSASCSANRATGSVSWLSRSLMTSISNRATGHDSAAEPVTLPLSPGCCGMGLLLQRDVFTDRGQAAVRRAVEHLAARVEPRPVQRAVPGPHRRVPVDHTAEVRASGRALVNRPLLVAV